MGRRREVAAVTARSDDAVRASVFVVMTPKAVDREELDAWHAAEGAPRPLTVPGFVGAERWIVADGEPRTLTIFDASTEDAIARPAWHAPEGDGMPLRTRRISDAAAQDVYEAVITGQWRKPGRQAAQGFLFIAVNVSPVLEDEFNRWYVEEHVPLLFALPDVLEARRYRSVRGNRKYIATYRLTTPEVQLSAEWKQAVDTPWARTIRPQIRDRLRLVCRSPRPEDA